MSSNRDQWLKPSRMFHSIVLMGSGLALGCGGVAQTSPEPASGGSAGAGGAENAGGASQPIADHPIVVPPDPEFVNPLSCAPSQWTCVGGQTGCHNELGFALGTSCFCDPSRPAQASDCSPGEEFTCVYANRDADGHYFAPFPYQCLCRPPEGNCSATCRASYGSGEFTCNSRDNGILCECVSVVLLK